MSAPLHILHDINYQQYIMIFITIATVIDPLWTLIEDSIEHFGLDDKDIYDQLKSYEIRIQIFKQKNVFDDVHHVVRISIISQSWLFFGSWNETYPVNADRLYILLIFFIILEFIVKWKSYQLCIRIQ